MKLFKYAFLAFVLTLILPVHALADNVGRASFRYGLGIIGDKPSAEVKTLAIRLEDEEKPFVLAYEFGGWTDVGSEQGRKGSGYGTLQFGVRPESEHLYVRAFWGVAALTATDSQLGGLLQFKSDFGVGFQDRESFVGIGLAHISSAGIWKPNKGRDFLQLELGVRF